MSKHARFDEDKRTAGCTGRIVIWKLSLTFKIMILKMVLVINGYKCSLDDFCKTVTLLFIF